MRTEAWHSRWTTLVRALVYSEFSQPVPLSEGTDFKFLIGLKGNGTMPLTDNKSWVFFVACYQDGSGGWGIIHTKPALEKKVLDELLDYAESLGFNRKHFTHIRYDNCKYIVNTPTPPGTPTVKKDKPQEDRVSFKGEL